MAARPSLIVTLVLAALPLGCGPGSEMALVDPGKFTFHNCQQLDREMKRLREREQELKALHDKASREAPLIAQAAYEPEYRSTVGNIRLIEAAAQERKCDTAAAGAIAAPTR